MIVNQITLRWVVGINVHTNVMYVANYNGYSLTTAFTCQAFKKNGEFTSIAADTLVELKEKYGIEQKDISTADTPLEAIVSIQTIESLKKQIGSDKEKELESLLKPSSEFHPDHPDHEKFMASLKLDKGHDND